MVRWLLRLADGARHRARLRKWAPHEALGRRGEDLAHRYLEDRGLTVVARNYQPPSGSGEVDLIAWDGPTLVLVEVKSRAGPQATAPERNVDEEKLRQIVRAGRDYARRTGTPWERVRVDVVSVVVDGQPVIRHLRDAFRVKTL